MFTQYIIIYVLVYYVITYLFTVHNIMLLLKIPTIYNVICKKNNVKVLKKMSDVSDAGG